MNVIFIYYESLLRNIFNEDLFLFSVLFDIHIILVNLLLKSMLPPLFYDNYLQNT